ncbi:hypothetical protein ABIF74_009003 [Bradyrhizobium japonicum]
MGKLLDPHHWSRAVDQLWVLVPARGNVMPGPNLVTFFSVACKTLEQLVDDEDFDADLNMLAQLVAAAPDVPPKETSDFRRFLESFLAAERALLIQSKMNEEAAAEILSDVRQVVELMDVANVDIRGLALQLRLAAKRTCAAHKSENKVLQTEARYRETWKVIKGCAIVGIDGGSVAIASLIKPIIGGIVAAGPALISARVGSTMVSDVLKDRI